MPTHYRHSWTHLDAEESYEIPARPAPGAPNIVVILLDDTGFAELGCYGSEIATPNIDRLATEGLRYTNFHTTSLCSSSRACLLTGRNHHAAGMRMLSNVDSGRASGRGRIHRSCATLAEMLRPVGYNTFAVGKWHLTPMEHTGPAGPYDDWPLGRGFERFYGFMEGATDHFHPELTCDNHRIDPPGTPEDGYHLTEDLVDRAIGMLRDQVAHADGRPFFVYLATGATHAPHQAPDAHLEAYRGRFDEGYDVIRERRFARQIASGIVPPDTVLPPPNPDVPAWDALSAEEQLVAARLQEAYAGFLTHTDEQIGRLLDELDALGVADNTIVMVLSDNGAAMEGGPVGAVSRIRFFNDLPEDTSFNLANLGTIGGPEGDNHYPRGWAQAGNTPGRWYKYHAHSGGVRDPLVVRWPAGIAERGGLRRQFHHIIDIAPTLLELASVEPPAVVAGVPQQPIHGVSMRYSFADPEANSRRRVQYFEMFGNRAIYADGWKAVSRHHEGSDYDGEPWELYHYDRDVSEACDLAAEHPGKLDELIRLWHVEAGKYDVLPLDDRSIELFTRPPLDHAAGARTRFVFASGVAHIPNKAAPDTIDRSHRIEADVVLASGEGGALVIYGNRWSGYGMYVDGDRLVYEYNFCGEVTRLVSDVDVPEGACTLGYEFHRTGPWRGDAVLLIDGAPCARAQLERTLRFNSLTGMDIGRNVHGRFSPHLAPPATFTGTLVRVVFTLAERQG